MTARVIILEDDVLVGIDLVEQLIEDGFDAVGPFVTIPDALADFHANGCDLAVLDVNLGKKTSVEFADVLRLHGIPFVVLSGYTQAQHPKGFQGETLVSKPVYFPQLVRTLKAMLPDAV